MIGAYLVAVEAEKEFECVVVKHLDGRIKKGNGNQFSVWRMLDAQHFVRHFQRAHMQQRQTSRRLYVR